MLHLVSFGVWSHVSHLACQGEFYKLKHIPTVEIIYPPVIGTPHNLKKQSSIPWTCFFTPGVSCKRPNMAELANDMEKLGFELWLLKGKCHSHISESNLKDFLLESKWSWRKQYLCSGDKEQSQILLQMIWYIFHKVWIWITINISSTFSPRSHPSGGFPRNPPNPRPRPRPNLLLSSSTTALASRSRWTTPTWPFPAAKCSGV